MNMSLTELEGYISPDISLSEYLLTITECIQYTTGCEHIGIRLQDEEGNIPFAVLVGFEDEDWRSTEPYLNLKHDCCFCTRINEGAFDPDEQKYASHRGSLHIADCGEFIDNRDQQRSTRYIGKCFDIGIGSMALVPLIAGNKIVGNIHVADNQPGTISKHMVQNMEDAAPLIAKRISKKSKS